MKVAVSLVGLRTPRMTGVERYSLELVRSLLELDSGIEIVPIVHRWAADQLDVDAIVVPDYLSRVVATEIWLPWQLSAGGFDLVHFTCFGAPHLLRTPFVLSVLDLVSWDLPATMSRGNRWYFRPLMNAALKKRNLKAVVSLADSTATEVAQRWALRVPVVGSPPGISGEWFANPDHDRPQDGPLRILTVGTLEPRKGTNVIASAARLLLEMGIHFEWTLVGRSGWGGVELPRCVVLCDGVLDGELRAMYQAVDVLVAPSFMEGFDLPVAEALAAGTSVIASNIPVHVEHFGSTVSLFTAGDGRSLADCLAQRVGVVNRVEDQVGRIECVRKFGWATTASTVVQLWQMVSTPNISDG